jgi:predicted Zn-dependent protease
MTGSRRLDLLERMIEKGTDDPFVRYARALELRSLGREDEALRALGEVRDRHPDYVPSYLMAGQIAIALGHAEDARAWLTRGVEVATRAGDDHALAEMQRALGTL